MQFYHAAFKQQENAYRWPVGKFTKAANSEILTRVNLDIYIHSIFTQTSSKECADETSDGEENIYINKTQTEMIHWYKFDLIKENYRTIKSWTNGPNTLKAKKNFNHINFSFPH